MARVLVVYSSLFGAGASVADLVSRELTAAGAEVRVRGVRQIVLAEHQRPQLHDVPLATEADLVWADGLVFESPAHTGLLSAAIKAFIDEQHDAAVAGTFLNRTFTALATSAFAHAGQERVVGDLNAVGAAWGCVLVPPSTADADINRLDGNPYGLSFVLEHGQIADVPAAEIAVRAHMHRFLAITDALSAVVSRPGAETHDVQRASDVFG